MWVFFWRTYFSSNCTNMELKLIRLIKNLPSLDTSNCTNMELKQNIWTATREQRCPSNCTNMELKHGKSAESRCWPQQLQGALEHGTPCTLGTFGPCPGNDFAYSLLPFLCIHRVHLFVLLACNMLQLKIIRLLKWVHLFVLLACNATAMSVSGIKIVIFCLSKFAVLPINAGKTFFPCFCWLWPGYSHV